MRRALEESSQESFDVVVIGGGIYGASVARDAALRGLNVGLVEQGDFGNGTSSNSHKIIHGGLRYLQHADFRRMRESIRERSTLMRIAPHLVYPMPFLIPTYRSWSQGKLLLSIALKLNDLIGFDRNADLPVEKFFPKGRVISKSECLQFCPSLDPEGLSGGALFYDGQVGNPERFILATLFSASGAGARLMNYAQVTEIIRGPEGLMEIKVQDSITQKIIRIRSRIVVNCAGPWVDKILNECTTSGPSSETPLLKAMVLVTRPLSKSAAVGVPGKFQYKDEEAIIKKGHRYFFITPWRNRSLIGTFQRPYDGNVEDCEVTDRDINELLAEVNLALPGVNLVREDVYFINRGLLPRSGPDQENGEVQVVKHWQIRDHSKENGVDGLISVVGVKWTTARDVAEKVTDLVLKKLGKLPVRSQTASLPISGGDMVGVNQLIRSAKTEVEQGVDAEVLEHLVQTYGSNFKDLLAYGHEKQIWRERVCEEAPVIKGEILHAIRKEMALKLEDVIFRRTDLGTAGYPGDDCLRICANIMASELGWSTSQMEEEIEEIKAVYDKRRVFQWGPLSETYVS